MSLAALQSEKPSLASGSEGAHIFATEDLLLFCIIFSEDQGTLLLFTFTNTYWFLPKI